MIESSDAYLWTGSPHRYLHTPAADIIELDALHYDEENFNQKLITSLMSGKYLRFCFLITVR